MKFRDTMVGDFRKALALRKRQPSWNESNLWRRAPNSDRLQALFPTVQEVADFCAKSRGHFLFLDIETTRGNGPMDCALICVGIWDSQRGDGLCIPLYGQFGVRYWTPGDEVRALDALRTLLLDPDTTWCGHNIIGFDKINLLIHGFEMRGRTHDTMQIGHVIDSELPQKLGFWASRCLEAPYWKDDIKSDSDQRTLDAIDDVTFRIYNLRDCKGDAEIFWPMWREMEALNLVNLYLQDLELCEEFAWATIRGIGLQRGPTRVKAWNDYKQETKCDTFFTLPPGPTPFDRRDNPALVYGWQADLDPRDPDYNRVVPYGLGPRVALKISESLGDLRAVSGLVDFNPNRSAHLRYLLYDRLRFPVLKTTKKAKLPSADKETMMLLAAHATKSPERTRALTALIRWKKYSKQQSNYTGRFWTVHDGKLAWNPNPENVGLPILSDGRLHPSWKNLLVTGRLASSPNAQNWQDIIKWLFGAGLGRSYVATDESQVELRAMGYFAGVNYLGEGDRTIIDMYEPREGAPLGLNVHSINTAMIFERKANPDDSNEPTEEFLREIVKQLLDQDYDAWQEASPKAWKTSRRQVKSDIFAGNYGAEEETVFSKTAAERDKVTDEPAFPGLELKDVQMILRTWFKMHPGIPGYWKHIAEHIKRNGGVYRDPISGRLIRYRAGPDRNKERNNPIQMIAATWMNKCTLIIARRIRKLVGSDWTQGITFQVHDQLGGEYKDEIAREVGKIHTEEFGKRFQLFAHSAWFPADKPKIAQYLNEV